MKNHNYTPLVFFLITGKILDIYQWVFYNLLIKMKNLNLNFSPRIIYADFEQAIRCAISVVFPNAIRKYFRFPLGQSIWKKI